MIKQLQVFLDEKQLENKTYFICDGAQLNAADLGIDTELFGSEVISSHIIYDTAFIVEYIESQSAEHQVQVYQVLAQIDRANRDCHHFMAHLASSMIGDIGYNSISFVNAYGHDPKHNEV